MIQYEDSGPEYNVNDSEFNIHFNPSGFYNGKNSWLSDDSTVRIIWDTTLNAWRLSGNSFNNITVINQSADYPPLSGWVLLGSPYTVTSNEGLCVPISKIKVVINKSNPTCTCNGTITVTPSGGVPPYQYSYNNGVTFINSPIKMGLCGGIYNVVVKDSEDNIFNTSVTMPSVQDSIEYSVNLNTKEILNTGVNTYEYTFELAINPPLDNGVTLTFDLTLLGDFMRTPYSNSANSSFATQVIKNGNIISGVNNTVETVGTNTSPGCQGLSTYITNYSYKYNTLTIDNNDTYVFKVITSYALTCNSGGIALADSDNELGPLSFVGNTNTLCCNGLFTKTPIVSFISNPILSNCPCCTVISNISE